MTFSCCYLLLLEVCSWRRVQFENTEESEHLLFEAAAKQRLLKVLADWEDVAWATVIRKM